MKSIDNTFLTIEMKVWNNSMQPNVFVGINSGNMYYIYAVFYSYSLYTTSHMCHWNAGTASVWNPHFDIYYSDVIMGLKSPASGLFAQSFVSDAVQRKHQRSSSLACVSGIPRWPVDSPHKGPVSRKMFPFDNVIMLLCPDIPTRQ